MSSRFCDLRDGIVRDIRKNTGMTDRQTDIREWLRRELATRGHGAKGRLAQALGIRADAITRMLNEDPKKETREIKAHELEAMRQFFGSAPTHMSVPIMGYVGAGAEVEPDYEQVPPEGLDQIDLPFPVPDGMIAFKVKGSSMMPTYRDGTVIIVHSEQRRPLEAFYGEDAAVRTSDGRRFIKMIMRGANGTVNLFSTNDVPIENVHLEWIGEIFAILPASALRFAESRMTA